MLLLPLFLQTAVGLHCSLPLLLHHSLSGHGRLVCGGHAVTQERVEEQRPRALLDDTDSAAKTHSSFWSHIKTTELAAAAQQLTWDLAWAFLGLVLRDGGASTTSPKGTSSTTQTDLKCLWNLNLGELLTITQAHKSFLGTEICSLPTNICFSILASCRSNFFCCSLCSLNESYLWHNKKKKKKKG